MNNKLKDILSNSNKDIDNQQLMDYLSQQLSKEESHAVEMNMTDDEFMSDAVDGLQHIEDKKNMQAYVEQLNNDLQKQIAKNKIRKEKRRIKDQPYTIFTIILLLVLVVISFIVLKKYLDARQSNPSSITNQNTNGTLK